MIYIETEKELSGSFLSELESAGLPRSFEVTRRRVINGKVEKGHPRALRIEAPEGQRDVIQAILDAHVPNFEHVDRKILETKFEASRRINEVAPLWKQMNVARENPNNPIFKEIDSIRKKSDSIEAHLTTLTDAEAGVYDIENSPFWD